MRVSYLEIYNEEVRDLLGKDQNQRLEVRFFFPFHPKKVNLTTLSGVVFFPCFDSATEILWLGASLVS